MIFDSNMTALSASTVPMAEGYDCSYGAALALVESARNDLAVFRAMLNVDAKETAIRRENGGYMTEAQYSIICESALTGIWTKIKEFFSKLIAKVKAIFHTLISKLDAIFKSNKELVKKYKEEVRRKSNIGKLEVKWRKINEGKVGELAQAFPNFEGSAGWAEEQSDRNKKYMNNEDNVSDYKEHLMNKVFEDEEPDTYKIEEIGGIGKIISDLEDSDKNLRDLNKYIRDTTKTLEKIVNDADKEAKNAAKEKPGDDDKIKETNKVYDMALVYQSAGLAGLDVLKEFNTIRVKQLKAAFVKAIGANNSKLESSYVYLDALAEAAEQEVEDVINTAISSDGSELSELNNASRNVLDGGASDDPDRLVYGEDPDYERDKVDGTIRTDYSSREESAFFAAPLY